MEFLHQQLKSIYLLFYFIKSLYGILNLESWEEKKRKAILLLAYIADVSCLTNRSFYMRTLSLRNGFSLSRLILHLIY